MQSQLLTEKKNIIMLKVFQDIFGFVKTSLSELLHLNILHVIIQNGNLVSFTVFKSKQDPYQRLNMSALM